MMTTMMMMMMMMMMISNPFDGFCSYLATAYSPWVYEMKIKRTIKLVYTYFIVRVYRRALVALCHSMWWFSSLRQEKDTNFRFRSPT